MMEDMEANMYKLIDLNKSAYENNFEKLNEERSKEIDAYNKQLLKNNKEIKHLRKKILINSQEGIDNNDKFEQVHNGKYGKSSLYESIIIHIKMININYLLEIFDLNIQREEEVKKILEDKHQGKVNGSLKYN